MTETAKLYGGSLYELAAAENLDGQILDELEGLAKLMKANPDWLRLLSTPSLPKKERCGLLDEALRGQVHPYLLNFTKILCENGTLRQLDGCAQAYRVRYNSDHGILEATAHAATALTDEQTAKLKAKLEQITGKQVDLRVKTDPSVLGGIRLDMEGVQLDGTVQNRLAALRGQINAVTL